MSKAKSKIRNKRDNDTLEKVSDDGGYNMDTESDVKVNESFDELRITEEILQKFYGTSNYDDNVKINKSTIAVRYELPPDRQKPQTKKICVLKRAPGNVAAVPSSTLLEQISLRLDQYQRPVQHSILGSLEDFFKMSINKKMLTLQEIPPEFHHIADFSKTYRPNTSVHSSWTPRLQANNCATPQKLDTSRLKIDSDTKALKLWEQRMLERRNLQSHISKKVQRMPESLILNSGEEFRKKLENNYIISKSIPFFDNGYGYRLGSEFWKQNEEVGVDADELLHMSNTQAEKGYPPPILHVGVANQIKLEKGVPVQMLERNPNHKQYEKRRHQELKDIISELDPHRPEITDLIITGSHIINTEVAMEPYTEINDLSETLNQDPNHDSFASQDLGRPDTDQSSDLLAQMLMGPCLFINNVILNNYDNVNDPGALEIRVVFNDYTSNKCLEEIHFHNKGSSIIRFWWKKLESFDPFVLENKNVRRFYFNTQDGILLPNQELNFPIIFKSDKSGIFSEQWRLETLPTVARGQDIVITLKGIALQRDTVTNVRNKIEEYLNYRVAKDVAHGILDEILQTMCYNKLDNLTVEEPLESEENLFNVLNEGIMYGTDNVISLRKIHRELTSKKDTLGEEWNLNCAQLRVALYQNESLKGPKKDEMCTKFYDKIDTMMFSSTKSDINQRELLYRIGYRILIDFGGDMYTVLGELRRYHDIPDMELRMLREKKGSNLSRQRTNNSQLSKVSKKQNDSRASVSATKQKSKEPSILFRDSSDTLLVELDEPERFGSMSASDVDDLQLDNEMNQSGLLNPNVSKYRTKAHQMIYALLNGAINEMIKFWDDVSQKDLENYF